MHYTLITQDTSKHKPPCLILPVFSHAKSQKGLAGLESLIKSGAFTGKMGQTFWVHETKGIEAALILLVGCGEETKLTVRQYREILKCAWQTLLKTDIKEASSCLHHVKLAHHDEHWAMRESLMVLADLSYQFEDYKSKPKPKIILNKLHLVLENKSASSQAENMLVQATHAISAMNTLKDLGHTPPNVCNPTYLAQQAKKLAQAHPKIKLTVLDEAAMKKEGMNVFLSVSQGSDSPSKLIIMEYKGGKAKDTPIVFVGKGITFDTGGNDIKPAAGMLDMKYDMCGAATVLALIQFCAQMKLAINVVGVMAAAENMVNGRASRPSDIYTSLSGLTVEITNTDAEGRLVLCDAITYARHHFKPKTLISIATLTGAAIIALGNETTALMSNHADTAKSLIDAGERAEDRAWQLPLFEEYHDYLKSEFADLINANLNRVAGTITSGCFLSRFAEGLHWAHLDIAGTAMQPGRQTKSSGRPLPLLIEYVMAHTEKK